MMKLDRDHQYSFLPGKITFPSSVLKGDLGGERDGQLSLEERERGLGLNTELSIQL